LASPSALNLLAREITTCKLCPRLRKYCLEIARTKRRAYRDQDYWGLPVPAFGDPRARVLIIGLAPGAHGANRTGRMFTGDRSGDFLYRALYDTGFANQPTSIHRDDGLHLKHVYIAAAVRCAPPANKPLPSEILNCRGYLKRELAILRPKAILALGKIAWDAYLDMLKQDGLIASRAPYKFAHGAEVSFPFDGPHLFGIYHPSQQNTQTGRVTPAMYDKILLRIRDFLSVK
jgi:uracil-DNA glycosylase family 4